MRPRSWLLSQACRRQSQRTTVVVEIADCFVVIIGATVVAETRRREAQRAVDAVVGSVLEMTSDVTAAAVIDAPSTVAGAGGLSAMIADGLQASGRIGTVLVVDDARLKTSAAQIIQGDDSNRESHVAGRDYRRHWALALAVLLVVAVLGVLGTLASARRGALLAFASELRALAPLGLDLLGGVDKAALQQYLHTFFGGSLRQMMTALVREGSWDDEDLDALKAEIERARKGRKQP